MHDSRLVNSWMMNLERKRNGERKGGAIGREKPAPTRIVYGNPDMEQKEAKVRRLDS
jgi:hypothetical protein